MSSSLRRSPRVSETAKPPVSPGQGDSSPLGGPPDPDAATLTVSYEPERDGDADPGEVVWTWVPYEDDPSQGKDRPVLVLGREGSQVAVVRLSSKSHDQRRDSHEWVPVGSGAWDSARRPSFADASRLIRVDPDSIRREGAALDRRHFDDVLERVAELHGWEQEVSGAS